MDYLHLQGIFIASLLTITTHQENNIRVTRDMHEPARCAAWPFEAKLGERIFQEGHCSFAFEL